MTLLYVQRNIINTLTVFYCTWQKYYTRSSRVQCAQLTLRIWQQSVWLKLSECELCPSSRRSRHQAP